MEINEALRSTPAIRKFLDEAIDDDVLAEILDVARFAPSGGNRQGWHVIVLKDPDIRTKIRDLYISGWHRYQTQIAQRLHSYDGGAIEGADEGNAATLKQSSRGQMTGGLDDFALHLDEAPLLLLVLADTGAFATMDQDLDRYHFAGGASIYPFCWNILLAARERGIGGVMTTLSVVEEVATKQLLGIPDQFAIASLLVMGRPQQWPRTLRRLQISEFTSFDRFDGEPLQDPRTSA